MLFRNDLKYLENINDCLNNKYSRIKKKSISLKI